MPLSTMFRPDNVSTGIAKAEELSDYCGLPLYDLVAFRVERLIVHELLIRVTAGIAVPDGTKYVDLGTNFRQIAATVLNRYIAPHRAELGQLFDRTIRDAATLIDAELTAALATDRRTSDTAPPRRLWPWPFAKRRSKNQTPRLPPRTTEETAEMRDQATIARWRDKSESTDDRLASSCYAALARVATAIVARRGRLYIDKDLIAEIAITLVGNDYGSEVIGHAIEPMVEQAVTQEGYKRLPAQQKPVVMNVKGASAAGKSTMRPLQRRLASKLNFPWDEFALISPDIWRKFLLDYEALGPAYKYAGTMTGHEVEIIDKKLDRYMAARAARGEMSHLLIDRFRFDSFAPVTDGKGSSTLLTRFGDLVYMFFVITPPEQTVERAWARGLKVGRYKAVEDLLAHNVEAFTGMPELFFTWALIAGKRVHYEFLDNSVAEGRPPRTVAFGWGGEMTVLDIKAMLDIDRFRKINIHAHEANEVYDGDNLAPEANTDFLKRCARFIPTINFADYETGAIYARLHQGHWVWRDEQAFANAMHDPDSKAGLEAVAPKRCDGTDAAINQWIDLSPEKVHTLGVWGEHSRDDVMQREA
ncbi:MAG: hypothetical protein GC182_21950 [Rhodopseudomonas sp.]|nr:hypothetical protein [Rhodopseudomonas sp.]